MRNRILYRRKITPNRRETGIVSRKLIMKERRLKIMNKLFSMTLGLVLPFLLVVFAFIIQKNELFMLENLFTKPMGILVVNLMIFYCIYFTLQTIINRPSASYIITATTYLALPIISRLKYDVRGEVLLHNDLSLASKLGEITEFVEVSGSTLYILVSVVIFVIVTTLIIAFQKPKTNRITSAISMVVSSLLVVFTLFVPNTSAQIQDDLNINLNVRYSPNVMHEKLGTILGFFANYKLNVVNRPSDYNMENVFKILDEANKAKENNSHVLKTGKEDIKPNIIMIMSESFFDPTRIKGVTYSQDPMPTVRKLTKEYTSRNDGFYYFCWCNCKC